MSNLSAAVPAARDVSASVRSTDQTDQTEILKRARTANDDLYSSLQSFVCNEQINRFRGKLDGRSPHVLDTITARLSFERGVEQYTNIYQNKRQRPSVSSFPGAWSRGEFGTLLLQTQRLMTTKKVVFQAFDDVNGERTAIYQFDVSAEDSPWDLTVASSHYRVPFRTKVWLSVDGGEILKIDRTTLGINSKVHISELQWCITLDRVSMNGKQWLLPSTGSYAVLSNNSDHREWNLISFMNYKHYGAETALAFE